MFVFLPFAAQGCSNRWNILFSSGQLAPPSGIWPTKSIPLSLSSIYILRIQYIDNPSPHETTTSTLALNPLSVIPEADCLTTALSATRPPHHGPDGRRRRRFGRTSRVSSGTMVLGDASVHKAMDDSNGHNERHGAVSNHHPVPVILQLPSRLHQVSSEPSSSYSSKP